VVVPPKGPPFEKRVQFGDPARRRLADLRDAIVGGDQTRKNVQPAFSDQEIVVAADECDAAQLLNLEPSPNRAEVQRHAFERDDAVTEAVQPGVVVAVGERGEVVDEKNGRVAACEELLEREDLSTIPQGVSREQTQLR
jgi:hypothetical protein